MWNELSAKKHNIIKTTTIMMIIKNSVHRRAYAVLNAESAFTLIKSEDNCEDKSVGAVLQLSC